MTEQTVCLADRYRIGESVVVEVTQPRQPCWKLGFTAGVTEVPLLMQETATTGWYYRVLTPGPIAAGDTMTLESRPLPDWTLARMIKGFYGTPDDREFLDEIENLPQLSTEWRTVVRNRLSTGIVEDWSGRLYR
jgi:MOSC domain-containing protein YiiM